MSTLPMVFCWRQTKFHPVEQSAEAPIVVADSWRVQHGTAWGLEDHIRRFLLGCAAQGKISARMAASISALRLQSAVQAVLANVTEAHPGMELFPRLSISDRNGQGDLLLLIRRAPVARLTTSLWLPEYTDPRIRPTVKGPDIDLMRGLVAEADADDVVLHDGTNVIEATTGALMLWETPDHLVLCQATAQLASISAQRVAHHARSQKITVTTRPVTIQDLVSGEYPVWFTNTLHGISPVTTIRSVTGETSIASHPKTAQWQRSWWRRFEDTDYAIGGSHSPVTK